MVAVGTSTPELVVSVCRPSRAERRKRRQRRGINFIFNIFVILGVCALIRPLPLTAGNIRRDIRSGVITRFVAAGAGLRIRFSARRAADRIVHRRRGVSTAHGADVVYGTLDETPRNTGGGGVRSRRRMARWLMAAMIVREASQDWFFGGENVPPPALRPVARKPRNQRIVDRHHAGGGGTSLPEQLRPALVSLFQGRPTWRWSSVIGSNIANILLILGVSATIPSAFSMGGITVWDTADDGGIEFGVVVLCGLHVPSTGPSTAGREQSSWRFTSPTSDI